MKIPSLPKLLKNKIYKTGQTRGADDDVIFQNRVNRNSTVLIPYPFFETCFQMLGKGMTFQNGFIVLITPEEYFETSGFQNDMAKKDLYLGKNALLFYYSRSQWTKYNPIERNLSPANNRNNPLGGEYVARVPTTTAEGESKIHHGFSDSSLKGAGIRVYEYANSETIKATQLQLEYIFWQCFDAKTVMLQEGMQEVDIATRKQYIEDECLQSFLSDKIKLQTSRILNTQGNAICPLCLEEISARVFFQKVAQAEGREVEDLTVTQLNLFHIKELRMGEYNHKPYNLAWGHHHCNIVVKDTGIEETLLWMYEVIERNKEQGFDFH